MYSRMEKYWVTGSSQKINPWHPVLTSLKTADSTQHAQTTRSSLLLCLKNERGEDIWNSVEIHWSRVHEHLCFSLKLNHEDPVSNEQTAFLWRTSGDLQQALVFILLLFIMMKPYGMFEGKHNLHHTLARKPLSSLKHHFGAVVQLFSPDNLVTLNIYYI